ncbi:hypothetical protein BZG35_10190 [Brevundimonas sp. LM2]|uniref:DUF3089 domain-containing protein n=1 Tax=Brevundimonas sp. LM2 TaxID=1938605 RepID=UPI000983FCEC|nr:DUF3089 domain-containing protein [Brevundimonas sp. LM2]AQR61978.1 hypothetical protein BZG35_10190 [Brevundimonas sp. LM2]
MRLARLSLRQTIGWLGIGLVVLIALAVAIWQGDILEASLDPEIPFQTYTPPPAPDYRSADAWIMRDMKVPGAGGAAVFFVHSTTFDGGRDWNSPIGDSKAEAYLRRVVLPNYAGPFARAGAISVPRYRQASLYTRLTLRDDARDARAFAYRDVEQAFDAWIATHPDGPIVVAGVEQGAELAERLLHDRFDGDPVLRDRLVAAYLMDSLIPVARFNQVPLCAERDQVGCALAWRAVRADDAAAARRLVRRALTWDQYGALVSTEAAALACVNPVTGSTEMPSATMRQSRGATNATNLEWGARPAFQSRIVSAKCQDGVLWHTQPQGESFRDRGTWAERRKIPAYSLFYADIESDVAERLKHWTTVSAGAAA